MNTRHLSGLMLSVGIISFSGLAQQLGNPIRSDPGVGARAIAMAGSYTALSADPGGMFWNPAGLCFSTRPQASVSISGLQPAVETVFHSRQKSYESEDKNTRFRIGNVGLVMPLSKCSPAPAFGFGFQNPYITDVLLSYKTGQTGDGTIHNMDNQFISLGQLSFWTVSGALPLSRRFSFGISASFITGDEINEILLAESTVSDSGSINSEQHLNYSRDYRGYDVRFGLMIRPQDNVSFGARLELPATVAFEEFGVEMTDNREYSKEYVLHGTLKSYYKASCGAAFLLENLVFSTEVYTRVPRPKKSVRDHCGSFKSGGSVGVELRPRDGAISLRGGYGWDEYDPTPYRVSYKEDVLVGDLPRSESPSGIHNLGAGFQWEISDRGMIAASYGMRFYTLETEGVLQENHQLQHGIVECTLRF
ncbi:MAG: OmpP1/FadL family transporter [Chitinivibrionales bacterium]